MHYSDLKKIITLLEIKKDNSLISFKNLDFFKSDILPDKLSSFINNGEQGRLTDIIHCLNPENVFDLTNRKYLGSKSKLLPFIGQTILKVSGNSIETFFDPFAGTGVVARWMGQYTGKVIANDILYSNFLSLKVFLTSVRDKVRAGRLKKLISHCNTLKSEEGYVSANFGSTYFTNQNASKIDAVRSEIMKLYRKKKCSPEEKNALLVSLLYAMDKCANTVGQYDAFLKHIGSDVIVDGKHKIDSNVYKPLFLRRPFIFFDSQNEVYQCDANLLADKIKAEVVYLDPPYNHRQYIDCYHLLENVMLWEKPKTFGKTRKFSRDHLKSDYSRKANAPGAFSELIRKLHCRHIFLSYNSEGIIPDLEIYSILKTRGRPEIFEKEYTIFGHGAGVSRKRPVKERLFYVKVVR